MEFTWSDAEESFAREVVAFLQSELPPDWPGFSDVAPQNPSEFELADRFTAKLAERGWLTLAWPKNFGGQERTVAEQYLFADRMAYYEAPLGNRVAQSIVGPALMRFGTPEQRQDLLPQIAAARVQFALGYSEPSSGSDLASLSTTARREGDDFVVSGQKIWTSYAHFSDYIWLAARTNPSAPKHRGISLFIVPTDAPGVVIQPIRNMGANHHFNHVFLDDVRVPLSSLVGGEVDHGWYQIAGALDIERSGSYITTGQQRRLVDDLCNFVRAQSVYRSGAQLARARFMLSDLALMVEVATLLVLRTVDLLGRGLPVNVESSQSKVFGSEVSQRIAREGISMLGLFGTLTEQSSNAVLHGRLQRSYMNSVCATIGGGTSEVQRNIIAQRGLGLPR